jgi:uncharacterized protein YndB with AHSA1/START domain
MLGALVMAMALVGPLPVPPQQGAFVASELVVRLSTEIPVGREEVYDAWTVADQLVQWFPGSAQMTVTEGGEYRFGWDGWEEQWVGTYVEVARPERLVFTWQPPAAVFPEGSYETTVVLTFEELDGATRIVLEHGGFQGGAEMESHMEAWRGYLYNLRAFLLQR